MGLLVPSPLWLKWAQNPDCHWAFLQPLDAWAKGGCQQLFSAELSADVS